MRLIKSLILILLLSAIALQAEPQHFSFSETGDMMTLRITSGATLQIEGNALSSGDEIGIFTQDDVCVGAVVWENQTTAFNVYGATANPPADGLETDEVMVFKVWDQSAEIEYDSVNVVLLDYQGNVTNRKYEPSEPYKDIDELYAYESSLDTPVLATPGDQSTNVSSLTEFDWNDVQEATYYRIQVSTDQTFSTTSVDQSNINSSNYALSNRLQQETEYYWRVKAYNSQGESDWSNVLSFTTNSKHSITLYQGWNLISSYLIPENNNIEEVFSSIINSIEVVKNNDGSYIPAQNINNLQTWDNEKAYLVYATGNTQLDIYGEKTDVSQTVYNLEEGWNYISFPYQSQKSVNNMFSSIISNLLIVRSGYSKAYIPWFGINTVNNMSSGEGYLIYVDAQLNFSYPD